MHLRRPAPFLKCCGISADRRCPSASRRGRTVLRGFGPGFPGAVQEDPLLNLVQNRGEEGAPQTLALHVHHHGDGDARDDHQDDHAAAKHPLRCSVQLHGHHRAREEPGKPTVLQEPGHQRATEAEERDPVQVARLHHEHGVRHDADEEVDHRPNDPDVIRLAVLVRHVSVGQRDVRDGEDNNGVPESTEQPPACHFDVQVLVLEAGRIELRVVEGRLL
mmetsp:Transcript_10515/g.28065  ORF Transcript_10515/g.28065 Transcript_10515/m.28065 type:complete len:219 (+) Transcript_10515:143-799(+)